MLASSPRDSRLFPDSPRKALLSPLFPIFWEWKAAGNKWHAEAFPAHPNFQQHRECRYCNTPEQVYRGIFLCFCIFRHPSIQPKDRFIGHISAHQCRQFIRIPSLIMKVALNTCWKTQRPLSTSLTQLFTLRRLQDTPMMNLSTKQMSRS